MSAALVARELYRFYHVGDDETLALRGVSLAVEPVGAENSSGTPDLQLLPERRAWRDGSPELRDSPESPVR